MKIRLAFLSIGLTGFISSGVSAQSVTILSNNEDARECYYVARVLAAHPAMESIYTESSCNRALEQKDTYSTRDLAALYINRGIILGAQEDYQAAFNDYKTALDIDPEIPETYVNLGNLYFLSNKLDRAKEFYDKSLELGIRKSHVVILNRGMVYEKKGQLEQAEIEYRKALELVPEWQLGLDKLEALHRKMATKGEKRESTGEY